MPDRRLGAFLDHDQATFVVHAPAASAVSVVLVDEHRSLPLRRQDDGAWHGHTGASHGTRYRLDVDGVELIDPYARAVDDTSCLVVAEPAADEPPPAREPGLVYELHVRGATRLCASLPPQLRGTYAGLAAEPVVGYLTRLGVTHIELLPVLAFRTEPALVARGLTNYWGYSPVAWLAPHPAYASSQHPADAPAEFQRMTRDLRRAGVGVILDVVFNHTGEGDPSQPPVSLRGLDAGYFLAHDLTGCGNTLDATSPAVQELVLTSLRSWRRMGVEGFRFDLASVLGWAGGRFDRQHPLLEAIRLDPALAGTILIAEPWHATGGYQLGGFPRPFRHWNDRYRDDVRSYWRGTSTAGVLAQRLTGSADVFRGRGLTPRTSINYLAAHDGFTLRDCVTYDAKHNYVNGEQNHDGGSDVSWNSGVEGDTDDAAIRQLRAVRIRSMLASAAFSVGVPMLAAGDERLRTQYGNNNNFCHDDVTAWLSWQADAETQALAAWVARLFTARAQLDCLGRDAFLADHDARWFGPDGAAVCWNDPARCQLGVILFDKLVLLANGTAAAVCFCVDDARNAVVIADSADPDSTTSQLREQPWRVEPFALVVLRLETGANGG